MLDDRSYMRSEYGARRARPPLTTVLICINVAVFLLQTIYEGNELSRHVFVHSTFALSLEGLKGLQIWQLLTYQFMHASLLHLIFNCVGLYFAGRFLEVLLGRTAFLTLYFAGGIAGGILQVVAGFIPAVGQSGVVGASACVMALLGAICFQLWGQRFQLLLMFIPLTLTGKSLFILFLIFDGLGILMPQGQMAHYAHLGGLLTGYFFMRNDFKHLIPEFNFEGFMKREGTAGRPARASRFEARKVKNPAPRAADSEDFISSEVDPILDKISAHGIHSLTDRERAILEKAQKSMSKR
ncbi:MAG TPA: hypothetical protein DCY13_12225 [Verrucomicrobiales bacterium]|nr:hypothetical protein [Verrucomicrobiales bacterium]